MCQSLYIRLDALQRGDASMKMCLHAYCMFVCKAHNLELCLCKFWLSRLVSSHNRKGERERVHPFIFIDMYFIKAFNYVSLLKQHFHEIFLLVHF